MYCDLEIVDVSVCGFYEIPCCAHRHLENAIFGINFVNSRSQGFRTFFLRNLAVPRRLEIDILVAWQRVYRYTCGVATSISISRRRRTASLRKKNVTFFSETLTLHFSIAKFAVWVHFHFRLIGFSGYRVMRYPCG